MEVTGSGVKEKVKVTELNQHVVCVLCSGYLVDATTITECLHSFCRSCIVRYLETSKFCPVCEVQIHKTKPLLCLRPDKTLQHLVYKLVPGLFQSEMKRRREFYSSNPPPEGASPVKASEDRGELREGPMIYTEEEMISLCLQHCNRPPLPYKNGAIFCPEKRGSHGSDKMKGRDKGKAPASQCKGSDSRYLLCPSALKIGHLKKFLKLKFDLPEHLQIEVFVSDESLRDDYTLIDAAYISAWRRLEPLKLYYLVFDSSLLTVDLPELRSETPIISEKPTEAPAKPAPRGRRPGRRKKGQRSRTKSQPEKPTPTLLTKEPEVITITTSDNSEGSPASAGEPEEENEQNDVPNVQQQDISLSDTENVQDTEEIHATEPTSVLAEEQVIPMETSAVETISGYEMEVAMEVQIEEGAVDAGVDGQQTQCIASITEPNVENTVEVEVPQVETETESPMDTANADISEVHLETVEDVQNSQSQEIQQEYQGSVVETGSEVPVADNGLQTVHQMPPVSQSTPQQQSVQMFQQAVTGGYIQVQEQGAVSQSQTPQQIIVNEGLNNELLYKSMTGSSETVIILENESETISSDSLQGTSSPIYPKLTPLQQEYQVQPQTTSSVQAQDNQCDESNTSVIDLDTSTDEDNSYAKTIDIIENVENAHFALKNVVCIDADEPQVIEISNNPGPRSIFTNQTFNMPKQSVPVLQKKAQVQEQTCAVEKKSSQANEGKTVTIYIGKDAQGGDPLPSSPSTSRTISNSSMDNSNTKTHSASTAESPQVLAPQTEINIPKQVDINTNKSNALQQSLTSGVILTKDNLALISEGAKGLQSTTLSEKLSQVVDKVMRSDQTEDKPNETLETESEVNISQCSQDSLNDSSSTIVDIQNVTVDTQNVTMDTQNVTMDTQNVTIDTHNVTVDVQNNTVQNVIGDVQKVTVDTHDVSNEVTSSASPSLQNASASTQEHVIVSTVEETMDTEQSTSTVTKATVETQTGFDYGELSPQNSSYSDGSKSPSERGSESSLDGTPPRSNSRDGRGKSRERKSSKPVKINRGGSRAGKERSHQSQSGLNRNQQHHQSTPTSSLSRLHGSMPPTTYPSSSAMSSASSSSTSSSSSPQPAAPPAHAHQQTSREAPPIKRLRLMCNGFDPTTPNNNQAGMRPWMFPNPSHFMAQGHNVQFPPGMVPSQGGTAPTRNFHPGGVRMRGPFPQTPSNPFPNPYGFPETPAPPTTLANGYDQPLELVTKKSKDRKKEQEKEERRKKVGGSIRVPHLLRP